MQENERWKSHCLANLAIKLCDFKMDLIKWQLNFGCGAILVWNHTCDFKSNGRCARSILKSGLWFQTKLHSTQFSYHYKSITIINLLVFIRILSTDTPKRPRSGCHFVNKDTLLCYYTATLLAVYQSSCLGELEKAVETLTCRLVFPQHARSPKLPLVFLQLDGNLFLKWTQVWNATNSHSILDVKSVSQVQPGRRYWYLACSFLI